MAKKLLEVPIDSRKHLDVSNVYCVCGGLVYSIAYTKPHHFSGCTLPDPKNYKGTDWSEVG